ncbi:MAG: hypothetical protein ACI8PP_002441 [Candidatus Pseudothioglobus sp.]|jgi:hypothetical protein
MEPRERRLFEPEFASAIITDSFGDINRYTQSGDP